VTYTSYLILRQAAPEVMPHILFALAYGGSRHTIFLGAIQGVDYGPVGRIFEQYADWLGICDNSDGRFDNPIQFWRWLLSPMGRTDEDILRDAWKGPGNMWVFVRPDRCVQRRSLFSRRCLIIDEDSLSRRRLRQSGFPAFNISSMQNQLSKMQFPLLDHFLQTSFSSHANSCQFDHSMP